MEKLLNYKNIDHFPCPLFFWPVDYLVLYRQIISEPAGSPRVEGERSRCVISYRTVSESLCG
jgi:hypothetical protein